MEMLPTTADRNLAKLGVRFGANQAKLEYYANSIKNLEEALKNRQQTVEKGGLISKTLSKYFSKENPETALQERLDFAKKEYEKASQNHDNLLDWIGQDSGDAAEAVQEVISDFSQIGYALNLHRKSGEAMLDEHKIFSRTNPYSLSEDAAHALYELEAGEVEARLTMDRLDLTAEDRKNYFPGDYDPSPNQFTKEEFNDWFGEVISKARMQKYDE